MGKKMSDRACIYTGVYLGVEKARIDPKLMVRWIADRDAIWAKMTEAEKAEVAAWHISRWTKTLAEWGPRIEPPPLTKPDDVSSACADTFVAEVRAGRTTLADIDEWVEVWHDGGHAAVPKLHDWLGMTRDEYARWVGDDGALHSIVWPDGEVRHG